MAWDPTSGGEHLRGSWRAFMQGSVCAQQAETEWLFLTAFLVCFFFSWSLFVFWCLFLFEHA